LEVWTGTDWQLVRYERIGRINAFLVMEDDTTQTLDRAHARTVANEEISERQSANGQLTIETP
jgi:hypothetical protein